MPLTDLFNPTFFMFLGILLLVVALLVVYFENKMRDQNHKIASMLSLVSTLAEDMNGVKFGLNHLARNTMGTTDPLNTAFISSDDNKLITVSDDENDSDEESVATSVAGFDEDSVSTFEINDESEGENDEDEDENQDEDEESSQNEVKVLKLNISKEADEDEDYEENETLDDLEDLDDGIEFLEDQPEFVENLEDSGMPTISASDLKTININLEEPQTESPDFKKLPLPKLRTIVAEKGLSADASKLKKNELLKLLGSE